MCFVLGLQLTCVTISSVLCLWTIASCFTKSCFLAVVTSLRSAGQRGIMLSCTGLARWGWQMPHCCNKKCMVSWTLRHGAPCLIHTGSSLNALWLVPLVPLLFAFVTPLPCSTCVDLVLFVLMRASVVTFPLLSICSGRARNSSGGSTWWNGLRVVTGEPGVCCKGKSIFFFCSCCCCSCPSIWFPGSTQKFVGPPETPISFQGLPVAEPDFSEHEVFRAVGRPKCGKTTGMSKVSVELLRSLVATPLGLHALAVMLNAFLHEPEQANLELSFGWVILLPKSSYVSDAKGFRPIVCGEVFAKLAAKMATDRLVDGWAVPACCFGSVAGKGLAEALYIVKHAAQTSACLPSGTVFVQVDLSQAFDSLFVNSILSFIRGCWSSTTALSASLLRWVLLHSRLRFQLFDEVWWCDQGRGTQQGGTHSPTLFGRIVACHFQELVATWTSRGERPPFIAGAHSLYGLWFVDDSTLLFRNLAQAARLMPDVIALLRHLGLAINVSKSCVLGSGLPLVLPGCLEPFPVCRQSVYLGLPLQLVEDDELMCDKLCNRATAAFFSNRPLLTCRSATRGHRLRLFHSLVTASIQWSLCVVSVKQGSLRRFRVHCVTLLAWLLGARAHNSWFAVECLQVLRHCVKLWARVYSQIWDSLLARKVWQWIGHVLRMPPASLTRSVLLGLQPSEQQRRTRTGPNNSGHRNVIRFLAHHDIPLTAAQNRHQWHTLEDTWLRFNGVLVRESDCHVFAIPSDDHLWTRKCLQGSFHGQQLFVCKVDGSLQCCMELHRVMGWRKRSFVAFCLRDLLAGIMGANWLHSGTFHVRVLLFQDAHHDQVTKFLSETPMSFQPFHLSNIVTEVSPVPPAWAGEMKSLAEVLADWHIRPGHWANGSPLALG